MTAKELIIAELDKLPEAELAELYTLIQRYLHKRKTEASSPALLEQLSRIQIDGPEDFTENIDRYLSGEKQLVANLR